jgi:hypothetical protein
MSTKKTTTKKVTTGAKTAKTSAPMDARVKTETKPAAKVEAVVASKPAPVAKVEVVAVVEAPPVKLASKNEVDALVREAAFLFAKRRNFRNGTPTQDWLAAEAFVNERLTARGFTVSA